MQIGTELPLAVVCWPSRMHNWAGSLERRFVAGCCLPLRRCTLVNSDANGGSEATYVSACSDRVSFEETTPEVPSAYVRHWHISFWGQIWGQANYPNHKSPLYTRPTARGSIPSLAPKYRKTPSEDDSLGFFIACDSMAAGPFPDQAP